MRNAVQLNFILPIISAHTEEYYFITEHQLCLMKGNGKLMITSSTNISISPTNNGRVLNFVPGFKALPICIGCAENEEELFKVSIELIQNKE